MHDPDSEMRHWVRAHLIPIFRVCSPECNAEDDTEWTDFVRYRSEGFKNEDPYRAYQYYCRIYNIRPEAYPSVSERKLFFNNPRKTKLFQWLHVAERFYQIEKIHRDERQLEERDLAQLHVHQLQQIAM